MINCIKSTSFPKILKIFISHKICANVIRKATFRLMVTLDLKCQVNIVASKIPAISKSKPPCFFLIWYSLIVLISILKPMFLTQNCAFLLNILCVLLLPVIVTQTSLPVLQDCEASRLRLPCHVKSLEGQRKLLCGYQLNNEGLFLIKISRLLTYQLFSRRLMSSFF